MNSPVSLKDELENAFVPIESQRPLWDTAFFQIAHEGWAEAGIEAFSCRGDGVPFGSTSDGALSYDAASLFLSYALSKPDSETFHLLEVGAGTGLFAKLFLDFLKENAPEVYNRTLFLVTDGSEKLIDDQERVDLFSAHKTRVTLAPFLADKDWRDVDCVNSFLGEKSGFDAIFMTYLLASVAFDILAVSNTDIWQMIGATHIEKDHVSMETSASAFAGPDGGYAGNLNEIAPFLKVVAEHQLCRPVNLPYAEAVIMAPTKKARPFIHSHGALLMCESACQTIKDGGFVYIADYGYVTPSEYEENFSIEIYGGRVAMGVNFHQLDEVLAGHSDVTCIPILQDSERIVGRLLIKGEPFGPLNELSACPQVKLADEALSQVNAIKLQGELDRLVLAYDDIIAAQPFNWLRHEELSTLFLTIEEPDEALESANTVLAINPLSANAMRCKCMSELNVGRKDDALRSAQKAVELGKGDAKNYNALAIILTEHGDYEQALVVIATGFARCQSKKEQIALQNLQQLILILIDTKARALTDLSQSSLILTDSVSSLQSDSEQM